jgi:hypothetical protein
MGFQKLRKGFRRLRTGVGKDILRIVLEAKDEEISWEKRQSLLPGGPKK